MINILASWRVALGLILAILAASIIKIFIPELGRAEWYGWLLAAILFLLGLSIIVCTAERVRKKLGSSRQGREAPAFPQWHAPHTVLVDDPEKVVAGIKKARFFVVSPQPGHWVAEKGRWAWLNSVGFHLGLVVFLIGMGINSLWGFKGTVLLPEGTQAVLPDELVIFDQGPLAKPTSPGFTVAMQKILLNYVGDVADHLEARILIKDEHGSYLQKVLVNNPGKYRNWYLLYRDWGYSPYLTIYYGDQVYLAEWFNLLTTYEPRLVFQDLFPALPGGVSLELQLLPDLVRADGQWTTAEYLPRNPAVQVVMEAENAVVLDEVIPLGGTVAHEQWRIEFNNLRYYYVLDVTKDPGELLIVLGAWLAVIYGVLRPFFYSQRIWIKADPGPDGYLLTWEATAEFYKESFKVKAARFFQEGAQDV